MLLLRYCMFVDTFEGLYLPISLSSNEKNGGVTIKPQGRTPSLLDEISRTLISGPHDDILEQKV